MECRVREVVKLGKQGGAGNLVICEVLKLHLAECILDDKGRIDPDRIDLMGRMGRAFYVRASGNAVHRIHQTQTLPIIGYRGLPDHILQSRILSSNDLAFLAGQHNWPEVKKVLLYDDPGQLHDEVKGLLAENEVEEALLRIKSAQFRSSEFS